MRRLLALLAFMPCLALAQSLPTPPVGGFTYNYRPGPVEWNGYFTAKQDWIGVNPLTVITLPACGASTRYYWAVVTDALTPTYRGAAIGGGSVVVPVFCDGTSWTTH